MPEKQKNGFSEVFETSTEIVGWIQIVTAMTIIFALIGACLHSAFGVTGVIILAIIGLVIGILFATKKWKGKGTIDFLSNVSATPELDNLEEDKKEE